MDGREEVHSEDALGVTLNPTFAGLDHDLLVIVLDMEDGRRTHLILDRNCLVLGPDTDMSISEVQLLLQEDTL